MSFFHSMDLLKIFRMQEPVPKDLLAKNSEIGQYKEVVQEKDVLLRNCKAKIRELEQQTVHLETKNRELEAKVNPQCAENLIKEYESFYVKIMSESEQIIEQKRQLEAKLKEIETFCQDIMGKYEKAKNVITQYEQSHDSLKKQITEYEEIINSLTEEYKELKNYLEIKSSGAETTMNFQQQGPIKELVIKKQMKNEYRKSMFEPLKGLYK